MKFKNEKLNPESLVKIIRESLRENTELITSPPMVDFDDNLTQDLSKMREISFYIIEKSEKGQLKKSFKINVISSSVEYNYIT